jgi:hypothetical protein
MRWALFGDRAAANGGEEMVYTAHQKIKKASKGMGGSGVARSEGDWDKEKEGTQVGHGGRPGRGETGKDGEGE